jgi:short-subunit dehydrogenase
VLPGFVETEGFPQKNVLKSRLMGRFVIQPPQVAEAVLRSIEKGKGEITVPWFPYRPISIVQALSPGLVARFAGMSDYRPGSV